METTEALNAIIQHQKTLAEARNEELRGPSGSRGERGERGETGATGAAGKGGRDGRDGIDGKTPELLLGSVTCGDRASASLKQDENGVYVLSLVLPKGEKGERGEASVIPGPRGFTGATGSDGATGPRGERGDIGPAGESIKGDPGDRGNPGMTREEIAQVLIETLQDIGVITEQAQKLIKIRARLKAAIHETDSRHQNQLGALIRDVDKLF